MTMQGIDISNWQAGLVPHELDINFCICKATEGTTFVDRYCDGFVQDCISHRMPWGFYHFATQNDPVAEANFFVDNTANYFGHGIPVLDYEVANYNDCEWVERFMTRVHERTGIWCMLYCSAYLVPSFADSAWLPQTCGLWIAGYPYPATDWTDEDIPYSIYPWEFAAIWQFTSSLRLAGYDGNLDGDIAYMDQNAWAKYAGSTDTPQPAPDPAPVQPTLSMHDLCMQIMQGQWGNGDDRHRALQAEGYDADYVQAYLDDMYDVAQSCIRGDWGNGWNRYQALTGAGYDAELVQTIVNAILDAC